MNTTIQQTTRYAYLACLLACTFYLYDYLIQVAPAVIAHKLMQEFAIGAAGLSTLGACFFYAYSIMQIPAGILLDKYSTRVLLSVAALICAFGVLLFANTYNFYFAGFARSLIGLGSSISFIGAIYLAAKIFSRARFPLAAGIIQAMGCLGAILGEAPLANIFDYFGWRVSMQVAGYTTCLLALLLWFFIHDPHTTSTSQAKKPNPVAWRKLINADTCWIVLLAAITWAPVAAIGALWGVPYIEKLYNISSVKAASICSLFWLSLAIFSPIIGSYSNKIKSRKIPLYICFSAGLIGGWLFINSISIFAISLALLLLGIASSAQTILFALLRDITPDDIFGSAAGVINTGIVGGGGIAQQVVGLLLAYTFTGALVDGTPNYSVDNFKFALASVPLYFIASLLIVKLRVKETGCKAN